MASTSLISYGNRLSRKAAFPSAQPLLRTPVRAIHLNEPGYQTVYFFIYGKDYENTEDKFENQRFHA